MLPQTLGPQAKCSPSGVQVAWIGFVTKGPACVNDSTTRLETSVHAHQIGVTLHETESATDIIIPNVNFRSGEGGKAEGHTTRP